MTQHVFIDGKFEYSNCIKCGTFNNVNSAISACHPGEAKFKHKFVPDSNEQGCTFCNSKNIYTCVKCNFSCYTCECNGYRSSSGKAFIITETTIRHDSKVIRPDRLGYRHVQIFCTISNDASIIKDIVE